MTGYTISRLAAAAGVGIETVRFYQRKSLLPQPVRRDLMLRTGVHRYDETDLRRLRFIRSAQKAGFTLTEIGELLRLDASEDRSLVREMASQRVASLDAKIAELSEARDVLAALAKECEKGDAGPCPIIASFEKSSGATH